MLNGWIVIDKPLGISSAKAVYLAKKITGASKAGHAGTLDPLASGVLPIALGKATRTMEYLLNKDKSYHFTIKFGAETDTGDAEGVITHMSDHRPTREGIEQELSTFRGEIWQTPPSYSAIKVNGRAAYSYARDGNCLALSPRLIMIHSIELISLAADLSEATFTVHCSKGTYIRSIAKDLSIKLGSYGHVSFLRRTQAGKFNLAQAICLTKLEEIVTSGLLEDYLLPINIVLDDILVMYIDDNLAALVRDGKSIPISTDNPASAPLTRLELGNELVAIGNIDQHIFFPSKVFKTEHN